MKYLIIIIAGLLVVGCTSTKTKDGAQQLNESSETESEQMNFKATGNEPFWSVEIDFEQKVIFKYLQDKIQKVEFPAPKANLAQDSDVLSFQSTMEGKSITITLKKTKCMDSMSGKENDYTVEVALNEGQQSKNYSGCGNFLGTHQLNDIWHLIKIDNDTLDANEKLPYLEFQLFNNKVFGYGGCNRISGKVEADTDTISFGAMISTKMMCPGTVEQQLLNIIGEGKVAYSLDKDQLAISKDNHKLIFRKRE